MRLINIEKEMQVKVSVMRMEVDVDFERVREEGDRCDRPRSCQWACELRRTVTTPNKILHANIPRCPGASERAIGDSEGLRT